MRAHLLALAASVLLLSGCTSPTSDQSHQASTTAPTTVTTVVGELRPPVLTDTLHLLQRPAVTLQAPDSFTDLRIPLQGLSDGLATAANGGDVWSYKLDDGLTGISG